MKRARVMIAVLSVWSAAAISATASSTPDAHDSQQASYMAGDLLVNFTEEAARAIEEARAAGTLPRIGIESLDALMSQYGVTSIERVFPHVPDPEALKAKFPERAKRAPPGAEPPDLSHIYKLTLKADGNITEAVAAFEANPHVEYAQPNYLATVQHPPEGVPR